MPRDKGLESGRQPEYVLFSHDEYRAVCVRNVPIDCSICHSRSECMTKMRLATQELEKDVESANDGRCGSLLVAMADSHDTIIVGGNPKASPRDGRGAGCGGQKAKGEDEMLDSGDRVYAGSGERGGGPSGSLEAERAVAQAVGPGSDKHWCDAPRLELEQGAALEASCSLLFAQW
ncbi:hypothetical protein BDU57DRAFT_511951 [Ampelomyces quisqualis]|uniref:Uncharacterized protein n=1 Tax=Ampelomyces quisqualis TaxID=50730 RepID=A0A6A5QTS0_AMPQU|nr:hypothetical protein BDU57DRAFT_511951 [Ampelomyces quisqualis]